MFVDKQMSKWILQLLPKINIVSFIKEWKHYINKYLNVKEYKNKLKKIYLLP